MRLVTTEDVEAFRSRYLAGEDAKRIGESFGLSAETVRRWLRPLGIMRRKEQLGRQRLIRYSHREDAFDISAAEPAMAYWAGWLCADGSISGEKALSFEISRQDVSVLERFREFSGFTGPITHRRRSKRTEMSRIFVTSQQWVKDLACWGVVSRKSRVGSDISKVIKTPYLQLFFRGLFEGDGCIHIRKNGYAFLSIAGRPEVIDAFRCWLWDLDRNPGSLSRRSKITHVAQFGSNRASMVANRLYDGTHEDLCLPRKRFLATQISCQMGHGS